MLRSRTCTTPPSDIGLIQPGNEEMISLSAATVGVQDVMTHACVFPVLGGEPHTMDPQLDFIYTSSKSASFIRGRHITNHRHSCRHNGKRSVCRSVFVVQTVTFTLVLNVLFLIVLQQCVCTCDLCPLLCSSLTER